jgi:hypothetical protein
LDIVTSGTADVIRHTPSPSGIVDVIVVVEESKRVDRVVVDAASSSLTDNWAEAIPAESLFSRNFKGNTTDILFFASDIISWDTLDAKDITGSPVILSISRHESVDVHGIVIGFAQVFGTIDASETVSDEEIVISDGISPFKVVVRSTSDVVTRGTRDGVLITDHPVFAISGITSHDSVRVHISIITFAPPW